MTDPVQFILAVVLLLATPGPTNTVMATGGAVNRGEPPWPFMLAELGGYLAIVFTSRLALLPLIDVHPAAGVVLKCLVVAYLVLTAVKLWRTRPAADPTVGRISARMVFVTTFLNPKGLVFAVAVIPRDSPALLAYFLAFGALVLVIGLGWFIAGRTLGVLSGSRAAALPRLSAAALIGFAVYLAATIVG